MTEVPLIPIVDDDDLFRTAVEKVVRSIGYTACTFASADEYLQSSLVETTRCLIADVQMPDMNGLELQERLAHLGYDIPIIFLTAYPDDAVKARALNGGAICFLHKPLDLQGQRLVGCLRQALDRRGGPATTT